MDIQKTLQNEYLRRVFRIPAGRAAMLNQLADAESNGEGQIFERVLRHVDDPELQKMITKHESDEVRHAALFRAAAEAVGVPLEPVPAHLKLIDRLDRATGGLLDRPIVDRHGVMDAYLMLLVVEERAISQFQAFEPVAREIDPALGDLFAAVRADEERHLRYCHAVSKRYAPDEATRLARIIQLRALEARAFAENVAAVMDHYFARGWFDGGRAQKLMWRGLSRVRQLAA